MFVVVVMVSGVGCGGVLMVIVLWFVLRCDGDVLFLNLRLFLNILSRCFLRFIINGCI